MITVQVAKMTNLAVFAEIVPQRYAQGGVLLGRKGGEKKRTCLVLLEVEEQKQLW